MIAPANKPNNYYEMKTGFYSIIFILLSSTLVSAESEYAKLRKQLKGDKKSTSSYISNPSTETESEPLSMGDQLDEQDAECKAHRNSTKCIEYKKMAHSRFLAEKVTCEKDPLGKKCRTFKDFAYKRMMRRQQACRSGLDNRKCAIVRAGAKSAGLISR